GPSGLVMQSLAPQATASMVAASPAGVAGASMTTGSPGNVWRIAASVVNASRAGRSISSTTTSGSSNGIFISVVRPFGADPATSTRASRVSAVLRARRTTADSSTMRTRGLDITYHSRSRSPFWRRIRTNEELPIGKAQDRAGHSTGAGHCFEAIEPLAAVRRDGHLEAEPLEVDGQNFSDGAGIVDDQRVHATGSGLARRRGVEAGVAV